MTSGPASAHADPTVRVTAAWPVSSGRVISPVLAALSVAFRVYVVVAVGQTWIAPVSAMPASPPFQRNEIGGTPPAACGDSVTHCPGPRLVGLRLVGTSRRSWAAGA